MCVRFKTREKKKRWVRRGLVAMVIVGIADDVASTTMRNITACFYGLVDARGARVTGMAGTTTTTNGREDGENEN